MKTLNETLTYWGIDKLDWYSWYNCCFCFYIFSKQVPATSKTSFMVASLHYRMIHWTISRLQEFADDFSDSSKYFSETHYSEQDQLSHQAQTKRDGPQSSGLLHITVIIFITQKKLSNTKFKYANSCPKKQMKWHVLLPHCEQTRAKWNFN